MDIDQIQRAKSYEEAFIRARPLTESTFTEARKRLVWFLGIAGYVLVNGVSFWPTLLAQPLGSRSFIVLASPLILAAIAAVGTHLYLDYVDEADTEFYLAKLASIQQFQFLRQDLDPNAAALWRAIVLNDGNLAPYAARAKSFSDSFRFWEKVPVILLAAGFVWTFAGPSVIRLYLGK